MSEEEYNRKIKNIEKYLKSESYSKFLGKKISETIYDVIINEKTEEINYSQIYHMFFLIFFLRSSDKILKKLKFYIKNVVK